MASLTEVPGEAIAKGDFLGAAGAGACNWAVVCGGFWTSGTGACAVAGFCCIACWAGGGAAGGLGGPALRASINLRSVSLSTVGFGVCAVRFLSEIMSVLGGFTFCRSSGSGRNVASCLSLMGTITGCRKVHFGRKISNAMMMAWVIRGNPRGLAPAIGGD